MNKAVRKAVIAGNWKMNKTRPEAKELIEAMKPMVAEAGCEVVACVPFTNLETVLEAAKGSNIKVGAQNCHFEKSGAFTGDLCGYAHRDGRGVRHHRPLRASSVFRRD